jgi:hypothetical protein
MKHNEYDTLTEWLSNITMIRDVLQGWLGLQYWSSTVWRGFDRLGMPLRVPKDAQIR